MSAGWGGWARHALGIAITVLSLLAIGRQVNIPDVLAALRDFQWPYLFLGVASLSAGYALRIIRWSVMLRAAGATATFGNCSAPFLGAIALNNVLPLRLGDVVRALVFPTAMGITRSTAASSLIVERLVDLLTLAASLAIGILAIRAVDIPPQVRTSALYLASAGGALLCAGFLMSARLGRFCQRFSGQGRSGKLLAALGGLFASFAAMSRPRVLLAMLLLSMLVWAGESGLFYFVLRGQGIEASPAMALLVMAVATLATLVPSSPGYVGTFHLAAFTAISAVGGSAAQAGSYAVLVHLALWVPTTLAGAIAIWSRPALFRAARAQAS